MELCTLEQAAELLKISVRTVREYCSQGRIPSVMVGNKYRIRKDVLEKITTGELEIGPKAQKNS